MSDFTNDSFEFIFQPVSNTFADNTTYFLWGRQAWSTTVNAYLPYQPARNMYLEEVTVYQEPGSSPSTEPSIFSINERLIYPNSSSYSTSIRDHIISKNFTWNFNPTPLGLSKRFDGLRIPMVTGRLYVLKMQVPTMATNPTALMSIVLKGTYRID